MRVIDLFSHELMDFAGEAATHEELFASVSERLLEKGLVTEKYLEGIIKREGIFPTGLITQYLNIALPHGDAENIIEPFVYLVRVRTPISMHQMGDNQEMEVNYFFFLGINDGKKQVGLLSTLMMLFMNEEFVAEFKELENPKAVYEVLKNKIEIGEMQNV